MLIIKAQEEFLELVDKKAVIYDFKGNIIDEMLVTNSTIPIDLSKHDGGVYIVKLIGRNYSKEWKIIKL